MIKKESDAISKSNNLPPDFISSHKLSLNSRLNILELQKQEIESQINLSIEQLEKNKHILNLDKNAVDFESIRSKLSVHLSIFIISV